MAISDRIVPDNPANNFLTWNPLDKARDNTVLSNGNLISTDTSSGYSTHYGNIVVPSTGLYYVEFTIKTFGSSNAVGIYVGNNRTWANIYGSTGYPYDTNTFMLMHNGYIYYNGATQLYHPTFAAGDVVALVIDASTRNFWLRKNGSLTSGDNYTSGSQTGGVVGALTAISALPAGDMYIFTMASGAAATGYSNSTIVMNAGQDRTFGGYPNSLATSSGYSDANGIGDFYYQPPTGALSLCTQNIPEPAVSIAQSDSPNKHFIVLNWYGTSSSTLSIPNNYTVGEDNDGTSITNNIAFNPDLVWVKSMANAHNHVLFDSVRGFGKNTLYTNNTSAESTDENGHVSSVTSNKVNFASGSSGKTNWSSSTIGWFWRAGGQPASDGVAMVDETATTTAALKTSASASITPTRMSVNTKAGFSIVKYTSPNDSSDQTVPHGLATTPDWIITKNLDNTYNWDIYHSSVGNSGTFTTAAINSRSAFGTVNNSIFTTKNTFTHNSTNNYIAYCWHSVPGYSAFGSYIGNGSTDGPFIYTGFRPAWVMIKNTTDGSIYSSWMIVDSTRSASNTSGGGNCLWANQNFAEGRRGADVAIGSNDYLDIDLVSNGIKIRGGGTNTENNDPNKVYIYMAFASQSINFNSAR